MCVLHAGFAGSREEAVAVEVYSGVRGVDVGGGSGVCCLVGSPWREAQQSLMRFGS